MTLAGRRADPTGAGMETTEVRRVRTAVTIQNIEDEWAADAGLRPAGDVRKLEIADAVVDPGLKILAIPECFIRQLGLRHDATTVGTHSAVRLTIRDRSCTTDVMISPDDEVQIGRLVVARLDFVIDAKAGELIGNPAHGGEEMFEMY